MNVISISSDRKVFEKGSAVRARQVEYGGLAGELHIIVFTKKSQGFSDEKIAPHVYIYPTNSLNKFFYVWDAIARARKLKGEWLRIDLATAQDPFEAGLAAFFIARMFHARMHLQIHTDLMSKYFARESLLNRVRVLIAKFLLPRAHVVRVVSSRIKKSIDTFVHQGTPIVVLPIFVGQPSSTEIDPAHDLKKKYPQFNFRALVVARLAKEKNIESAITAMVPLVKTNSNAGLIIVGDGPERAALQKLVGRLSLQDHVIFEGWQDNIYSYYKTADVLVFPSNYEGYGLAAVEALYAECPVVMTDVGCAGDLVKDAQNGLVVPVGDTDALAHAISRVASGEAKFSLKTVDLPTKAQYLTQYQKSWQDALV